MTKQDLKDGMILETRNGKRYLLVNDIMRDFDGYIGLNSYNNDLSYKHHTIHDIVKIYKDTMKFSLTNIFEDKCLSLLWERKELTEQEVEVLKALKTLGLEWLARDKRGTLFVYENKPAKLTNNWFDDNFYDISRKYKELFNFIKWEDKEPTNIDDLLKGVIS